MGIIADTADTQGGDTAPAAPTLLQKLDHMRDQYAAALPPWLSIDTFLRDARTHIQQSILTAAPLERPDPEEDEDEFASQPQVSLLQCAATSVLAGFMTCAQLGLRPGVNNEAMLQPRWSRRYRVHVAAFQAGYQGLTKLAYTSGAVKLIYAQEVYAEDEFWVEYGSGHGLRHVPALLDDPGALRLFYGFARLPNGEVLFRHWMNSRMERHRAEYGPRNRKGPWFNPLTYPAMGRKTMIKQLAKALPITGEFVEAVNADDKIRMEVDTAARPAEVSEYESEADPAKIPNLDDPGVAAPADTAETPDQDNPADSPA